MLEVVDLACARGDRVLFEALSFTLQAGEALYVQGPNGAGKTTLLRTVAGLTRAEAGAVRWGGADRDEAFARALLYIGHIPAVAGELSAQENLAFIQRLQQEPTTPAQIDQALADVGLHTDDLPAKHFSQGQRRRLALARLLVTRRALWILDEPFASLDASAIAWLGAHIDAHCARGGMALLTSHQAPPLAVAPRNLQLGGRRA